MQPKPYHQIGINYETKPNQTKPNQTKPSLYHSCSRALSAGLILLLAFIAYSCESPTQPNESVPKQVLPIPAHGAAPLPGGGALTARSEAAGAPKANHRPPGYRLLKKYAKEHPEHPYVAIAGVWDAAHGRYEYTSMPLDFPDSLARRGVTSYWYNLADTSGQTWRSLAGLIPATEGAVAAMSRWLRVKRGVGAEASRASVGAVRSSASPQVDDEEDECPDGLDAGCHLDETIVTADDPDEDDGGGGGGWPTPFPSGGGDDNCTFDCGGDPGLGGGGGSGGIGDHNDPCEPVVGHLTPDYCYDNEATDEWEAQKIDDSKLNPCMQDEMSDLKQIKTGVGLTVQKFAGKTPGFNWTVKDGDLPIYSNGQTSQQYDESTGTVTTIFDSDKFGQATDLSVATVMLHEAVHAYVVATFYETSSYEERQKLLGDNWTYPAFGEGGHGFMVDNFINDISSALQEFGQNHGYNISLQYYQDLAWGGLTHYKDSNGVFKLAPWFTNEITDANDRNRILNNIDTEQTGKDQNGNYQTQKGDRSGC